MGAGTFIWHLRVVAAGKASYWEDMKSQSEPQFYWFLQGVIHILCHARGVGGSFDFCDKV